MADDKLAALLKTQKSLTEWLEDIKHSDAAIIRKEDNEKRERLRILNDIINLPFDRPTQFEAIDIAERSETFQAFLDERGEELCALRLIPKVDGLPKLRMRGKSIRGAVEWFAEQDISPTNYRADFVPHAPDSAWATIFIVNKHGIQGEIIYGGHSQLTQGFHDGDAPIVFHYDFSEWRTVPHNEEAITHLKKLAELIYVPDNTKKEELKAALDSTFTHDYIEGYFETTDSSMGTWYIDYSQSLGKLYADAILSVPTDEGSLLNGNIGSPGVATGKVVIVAPNQLDTPFEMGSILVCNVTTPAYVPLMQKAAAIITNQGGILSHAAIVARELKKPCIVGTGNATDILAPGQQVTVNADTGVVS